MTTAPIRTPSARSYHGSQRSGMLLDSILERNVLPDGAIRFGIRRLLKARLAEEMAGGPSAQKQRFNAFVDQLRNSPIAIEADAANSQHYEVSADFYRMVLGPHLKYSSAFWWANTQTLHEAEDAMLRLTCDRARLQNGQDVLELGCGWG